MPIRADILSQLADVLAELYPDQASARAMAMTAGLTLGQIPFDPKASNTWVFLLNEAEAQGRTQVLLDRVSAQYASYDSLATAGRAYTDWITAGRPMAQPAYARRGSLRAPPPPGSFASRPTAQPEYAQRGSLRAPPPPHTFAGRTVELQHLTKVLLQNQAAAISVAVAGMGGVGKTTLALKVASDLSPHFPGGVVWLEAGYGAGQSDLIDRLTRTLGMDLTNKPSIETRATILQSMLARRGRLLVIIDDLWDIDLGRWVSKNLLPGERVLLITSRDSGLCSALCHYVERLDVPTEPEAMQLFVNLFRELGQYESVGRQVVKLLDNHPLALGIAAGRCFNGASDLPWVLRRLRASPTLGELKLPGQETPNTSVAASLALSYGDLDTSLQERFRSLGVFAAALFDLAALAAVWEIKLHDEAEEIARQLVRRALLTMEQAGDGPVYHQHALLRVYARALLEQAGESTVAAARHIAYYQGLPGAEAANWQAAETSWNQIEEGWRHAWRAGSKVALGFYDAVHVFLYRSARHVIHLEWTSELLGLPAEQIKDQDRAMLLNNQGLVYDDLGDKTRALALFKQAQSLFQRVRNKAGEATTLNSIGMVYRSIGQSQRALESHAAALSIAQEIGDRTAEGATLNNMGLVYDAIGQPEQAMALFQQALPIAQKVEDRTGEAATLNNMALVHYAIGQPQRALELYEQSVALTRKVGDSVGEAMTLNNMGEVYRAMGQFERAMALYKQALPILQDARNRASEATILNNMAVIYRAKDQPQQALELYAQALPIALETGDRAGEAATLNNMAAVYYDIARPWRALELYQRALLIVREIRDRAGEAKTLSNMGLVYDAIGQPEQAMALFEQALSIARETGDRASEAATRLNMAMVYRDRGELDKAAAYLQEVVVLDEAIGHPDLESDRAALEQVRRLQQNQSQSEASLETESAEDNALSLDQLLVLVKQARDGNQELARQLTPFLQRLASNPDMPAEIQALTTVLLQLLAGTDNPDLNDLPAELAEAIRLAFDLPEA